MSQQDADEKELENTVIAFYKRSKRPFTTKRLEFEAGQPIIPLGREVDQLYYLRSGKVRLIPGSKEQRPPVLRQFEGVPHKEMPIIGARFYFTRSRATIAYVAETPCAVYPFNSDLLADADPKADAQDTAEKRDRAAGMLGLMLAFVSRSDAAEIFAPIAAKGLKMPFPSVIRDEVALRTVIETILEPPFRPELHKILDFMYRRFMEQRMKRAKQLGVEASICCDPPTFCP